MISPGMILIRNDQGLPWRLTDDTSPFSPQWAFLAHQAGRPDLEERLAAAGWTSFYTAGSILRAATGFDKRAMIKTALERVLAGAGLQKYNCLEIGEIKMHSFLAIRYASVSGHAHQLQAGTSPLMSQPLAKGEL
jgi:hypothetical protein